MMKDGAIGGVWKWCLEKDFPDYTMGRVGSPRELARPCSDDENPPMLESS